MSSKKKYAALFFSQYFLPACVCILIFSACSLPLADPAKNAVGKLALSVPRMASWIDTPSRAIAFATSVTIKITDRQGNEVAAAYTHAYDTAQEDKLNIVVPDVPIGSGYIISVKVYNDTSRPGEAVVSGTLTDVQIKKDQTTPITVVCLPVEPTPLTLAVEQDAPLPPGGERWFKLDSSADSAYTFTLTADSGTGYNLALFNSAGTLLARNENAIVHTKPKTETVYLALVRSLQAIGTAECLVLAKPNRVATPIISPAGGSYNAAQSASISCTTADATIRYTTDGSDPTESSTVFNPVAGIQVNNSQTIKARAFKSGMRESTVASAAFVINGSVTINFTFGSLAHSLSFSNSLVTAAHGSTLTIQTTNTELFNNATDWNWVFDGGTTISTEPNPSWPVPDTTQPGDYTVSATCMYGGNLYSGSFKVRVTY